MTRGRPALLLLLLFASFACQKDPIQIRHRPEVRVPDQWTAAASDRNAIRTEWWQAFEDSQLDTLVEKVLEHNYDLQIASSRLEAAQAQARIAGADRFPSVTAGWSGREQRQNFIGLPIPGSEGSVLSRTFNNSGVSLDASWEADVWGRVSAAQASARADFEAAAADLRAARLSLVAQTTKAWLAVLEGFEQVQLAERTAASYGSTAQRVQRRYRSGLQSSLDLRLALSSQSSAEALLGQRRSQLDRGIRQLEILLGEYPAGLLQPGKPLPAVPPAPPAGIPSELVSRRPDLIALERRMLAAGARWSQSRRDLYPSFSLTASSGTSARGLIDAFNGDFFVWSVAGSILQPIFQGGRLRAQVQLRDAQSREVAAQWAGAVLTAFAEVESALSTERFLADQEEDLLAAAQQATASLRLAEDRYNSGLESFVTVLEAQRRSLDSESQLLNVRRQRLDTRVDLHLALGGSLEPETTASPIRTDKESGS